MTPKRLFLISCVLLASCGTSSVTESNSQTYTPLDGIELSLLPGASLRPCQEFDLFKDAVGVEDHTCVLIERSDIMTLTNHFSDQLLQSGWESDGGAANAFWYTKDDQRLTLSGWPYEDESALVVIL